MVKGGWAQSLAEAREMIARDVVQALHYEGFVSDWDQAYLELNK